MVISTRNRQRSRWTNHTSTLLSFIYGDNVEVFDRFELTFRLKCHCFKVVSQANNNFQRSTKSNEKRANELKIITLSERQSFNEICSGYCERLKSAVFVVRFSISSQCFRRFYMKFIHILSQPKEKIVKLAYSLWHGVLRAYTFTQAFNQTQLCAHHACAFPSSCIQSKYTVYVAKYSARNQFSSSEQKQQLLKKESRK